MCVYEGREPYIFVSYSHKDSARVLPALEALNADGFRVWYDSGIEAGTEWPAYIEEHLIRSAVVLVFMSESAVESVNCRNEINFALAHHKDMLVIYLEETELRYGMGLQLGASQSVYAERYPTSERFFSEVCGAPMLQVCKGAVLQTSTNAVSCSERETVGLPELVGTDAVQKTTLTRKITYGGKTAVYPVYRVRLDKLFYNDQNDRIATWISRYEAEHGEGALNGLDTEQYNRIIEKFIVESNEDAIKKTQNNIAVVGQRESGVTLADGRIVDGNRRFTCLRRLQRERAETMYFETAIMDADIRRDKKQIKLLELAIQHGEEKKVDYDPTEYAIGTYRDIVLTGLLTADEYAAGTNEPLSKVNNRLRIAQLITEFLEYIRLPEQYHVAKEYQLYTLFDEITFPKQGSDVEKTQWKHVVFQNVMMKTFTEQKKFIRDFNKLLKSDVCEPYCQEQIAIGKQLMALYSAIPITSKEDIDVFVAAKEAIRNDLQKSMERALNRMRSRQLKTKPSESATKCRELLAAVDTHVFRSLDDEDKKALQEELDELSAVIDSWKALLKL